MFYVLYLYLLYLAWIRYQTAGPGLYSIGYILPTTAQYDYTNVKQLLLKHRRRLTKPGTSYRERIWTSTWSQLCWKSTILQTFPHSWNFYFIHLKWFSSFHASSNSYPQKNQAGKLYQGIKTCQYMKSWLWSWHNL